LASSLNFFCPFNCLNENFLRFCIDKELSIKYISYIKKKSFSAIDLFCGCGGISLGLERVGFLILVGVDIEKSISRLLNTTFLRVRQYVRTYAK
jgi:predicted RNA methylase